MSILTKVLKLFCYDPETDGANTFNIPKALNENWEKIDQLVLLAVAAAAAYDPEGSYAVGDYCTHSGKLHKCNTAIPDGEAWNAAHWTETNVAAELSKKIPLFSPPVANAPISTTRNLPSFFGFDPTCTDIPSGYSGCGLTLSPFDSGIWGTQIISINRALCYRTYSDYGNSVSEWLQLVTATSPQKQNLILSSGWSVSDNSMSIFYKTQENNVHVIINAKTSSPVAEGDTIATLPVTYRPSKLFRVPIIYRLVGSGNLATGHLDIGANGTIRIYNCTTDAGVAEMYVNPFAFPQGN